jgi:hypothetical protein
MEDQENHMARDIQNGCLTPRETSRFNAEKKRIRKNGG